MLAYCEVHLFDKDVAVRCDDWDILESDVISLEELTSLEHIEVLGGFDLVSLKGSFVEVLEHFGELVEKMGIPSNVLDLLVRDSESSHSLEKLVFRSKIHSSLLTLDMLTSRELFLMKSLVIPLGSDFIFFK